MKMNVLVVLLLIMAGVTALKSPRKYSLDMTEADEGTNCSLYDAIDIETMEDLFADFSNASCPIHMTDFESPCELSMLGAGDGVYMMLNTSAYCDGSANEKWLTILRRVSFSQLAGKFPGNFDMSYESYAARGGFGCPSKGRDHWIGLDYIHQFTAIHQSQLRIELWNDTGNKSIVSYDNFSISNGSDGYRLHVHGFKGTLDDDALSYHNGMVFSAYDNDSSRYGCSKIFHGGWWYKDCFTVLFTGSHPNDKAYWGSYVFNNVVMKIKPITC